MTVTSSANKNGPYIGDGVTTTFARTFKVVDESHLTVYETTDGTTTEVTSGITKTGIGDDTGNVVFDTAPASGTEITLIRAVSITQETDYSNQAKVEPEQVEDDIDKLIMIAQDQEETLSRAIVRSVTEDAIAEGLAFMSDGVGGAQAGPSLSEILSATSAAAEIENWFSALQFVTPEQYGAVGDGSTDDSAAFAAMVADLPSRGGAIMLGPKDYYLASDLTILAKTVLMSGVPGSATTRGSALSFASNMGMSVEGNSGSVFSNFRINGDLVSTSGALITVGKGSASSGCSYVAFQNVQTYGGYRSIWLQKSLETRFLNCRFTNATGQQALSFGGGVDPSVYQVDAAEFVQCVLSASAATTVLDLNGPARSLKFTQCAVLYGRIGMKIHNTVGSSVGPKFLYFSDGGFENQAEECVFISDGDEFKFSNMYASTDSSSEDIFYTSSAFDGWLSIIGSQIRGAGRDGIRAVGGNVVIVGNRIVNNGKGTAGDGVRLESTVDDYVLASNYIGPAPDGSMNQRYGVFNEAPNGVMSGNHVEGNITAEYGGAIGKAEFLSIENNGVEIALSQDTGQEGAHLTNTSDWVKLHLDKQDSGEASRIVGQSLDGGSTPLARWSIDLGDSTSETGSDVGSDFTLKRYNDAGDTATDALKVRRDDGKMLVYGEVTMVNDDTWQWDLGPSISAYDGDPEGNVTASPGSIRMSTNGNVYKKASGTGNTGWVAM